MKEFAQIWDKVTGRRYSGVNTDRELKELSNNRLQKNDYNTSPFESNLAECEGLNNKFEDFEFTDRKDAIINRLFERRRKGHSTRQPKCKFIF